MSTQTLTPALTPPSFAELYTPKPVTVFREGYTFANFRADLMAGLTVAIVALPLSMAIAIGSHARPAQGHQVYPYPVTVGFTAGIAVTISSEPEVTDTHQHEPRQDRRQNETVHAMLLDGGRHQYDEGACWPGDLEAAAAKRRHQESADYRGSPAIGQEVGVDR